MCFFKKIDDFVNAFRDLKSIFMPKNLKIIPNSFRFILGVCLNKYGVKFKMKKIPRGLYKKPFTIEFGEMLMDYSNGEIDIDAVNSYILGNFTKTSNSSKKMKKVSNILDPTGKFKDVWYGVYFVFDDYRKKGRKFILKDPYGSPRDKNNFNPEALFKLVATDQKLITWSSHQNQKGYSRKVHDEKFYFDIIGDYTEEAVSGPGGKEWQKIFGSFKTWSILPDTKLTDMELFTSNRSVCGLPEDEVYKIVKPWHDIIFHGSVITNYYESEEIRFWAVAYYGATEFHTIEGKHINNWTDTDVRNDLESIFSNMTIGTVKPAKRIDKYAVRKRAKKWFENEIKDKYR